MSKKSFIYNDQFNEHSPGRTGSIGVTLLFTNLHPPTHPFRHSVVTIAAKTVVIQAALPAFSFAGMPISLLKQVNNTFYSTIVIENSLHTYRVLNNL